MNMCLGVYYAAYFVGHVEVGEDDVKGVSAASAVQLIHGLLPIHHCRHLTVPPPLQDPQSHLHHQDNGQPPLSSSSPAGSPLSCRLNVGFFFSFLTTFFQRRASLHMHQAKFLLSPHGLVTPLPLADIDRSDRTRLWRPHTWTHVAWWSSTACQPCAQTPPQVPLVAWMMHKALCFCQDPCLQMRL